MFGFVANNSIGVLIAKNLHRCRTDSIRGMPLVADLQVLPSPPGNKKQKWKHVDAAIKVIAAFWWQLVSSGKPGCFDECHGKLTHMLMEDKGCSLFARYLHQAEASKLKHSVNALGTVVEGPATKVWSVCRTVIWDE